MTNWNINIIGDQSLDVTNGESHIYHERDWLSGEGIYERKAGYEIPTLIDLWEEVKTVSKIEELHYSDFKITRYENGFVFKMDSGYKDVVSDETAKAQDLLSFIDMLDEISAKENMEGGAGADYNKLIEINSALDSALEPKVNYDN